MAATRPIKFRSWNKREQAMEIPHAIANKIDGHKHQIMQFTGLTDRNGQEIYEGDIVEFQPIAAEPERYEVRWGHFGFTYWTPKSPDVTSHYFTTDYTTVIGNVYENPELLGGVE